MAPSKAGQGRRRARLQLVNRLAHQRAQAHYREAKASLLAELADEELHGRGADLVERWRCALLDQTDSPQARSAR